MRIEEDSWLARQLERPVYRVDVAPDESPEELADGVPRELAAHGDGFYHVKLAAERNVQAEALVHGGFSLVDVNVTLSRPSGTPAGGAAPDSVRIAAASAEQREALRQLGERCFTRSRFHADPLLPNELADRLNGRWVEDYVDGRGELLEVALVDDVVAGFNCVLRAGEGARAPLVIDLIGVAPDYQGRGIGAALTDSFLAWSADRCDEVRVGTQVANLPAIRLYESRGFRMCDAKLVLHAHVRDGRTVRSVGTAPSEGA